MASNRSPVASLLLVLALLVVAGGVFVVLSDPPEGDAATVNPSSHAAERPAPQREAAELAEIEPEEASRARAREETVVEPVPDETRAAVLRETPFVLAGTVVIEEPDGSLTEPARGEVQIGLGTGGSRRLQDVPVTNGTWQVEFIVGTGGDVWTVAGSNLGPTDAGPLTFSVHRLDVSDDRGGVVLEMDLEERFEPGTMDVVVTGRRLSSITLEVVDVNTGEHLRDVRVARITGPHWIRDDDKHPGDATLEDLVASADSPVRVQPSSQEAQWNSGSVLVGSPGYAWIPIDIDLRAGGTRRIELEPGGTLEIIVRGTPRPGSHVRLYAATGGRPHANWSLEKTDRITFEGVAPGDYDVRAETGMWFRSPRVDASAEVTVVASATERIELQIADHLEPARGALSGRLVLPREWGLNMFHLNLELLGSALDGGDGRIRIQPSQFERVGRSKDTFAFDVGEVLVGQYKATLSELEYSIVFDLGPEGRSDLLIEVPPPAQITVRVIDTTTGRVADLDTLAWNPVRPKEAMGGGLNSAERRADEEDFRLTVPRGPVHISTHSDMYGWTGEDVDALDGAEIVLEVAPVPRAILRLVDGETAVPWPRDDYGKGEAVDGSGRLGSRGQREGALHFNVTEAGRYRLNIPEINGFEPHPPVELDLVAGELVEHVVELVRRR
ncbi:MAG: hypothetical protein AAGI22_02355 [Planctomycetota bacterium]